MENDNREAVIGFITLITVFACVYIAVDFIPSVPNTPEYKEGYSLGYSEHNGTKYQAADDIRGYNGLEYTEEQYNYACGYYNGYEAYTDDEEIKSADNKRNETSRILGV